MDLSRVGGSAEVFDHCPFHEPDSHVSSGPTVYLFVYLFVCLFVCLFMFML